jgi:hypothetical protein
LKYRPVLFTEREHPDFPENLWQDGHSIYTDGSGFYVHLGFSGHGEELYMEAYEFMQLDALYEYETGVAA